MTEMFSLLQEVLTQLMTGGAGVQVAIAPLIIAAGIAAASSIGNSIFGSVSANKQKRKQLRAIAKLQQENRNWYNRRYNEDATQRADAQRMLTRANDAIKKRTQAAYGRKAVVGGTDATLAATQQANAAEMGNAVSQIVTNAEARKDDIEQQYRNRQSELEAQKSGVQAAASQAKRENTAAAVTGAVNAAASVISNSSNSSAGSSAVTGSNGATSRSAGTQSNSDWLKSNGKSIYDYPEFKRLANNNDYA